MAILAPRGLSNGVRVSQENCQRGLQGADDSRRNKLVVCRSHRTPGQVWNTLAHEAAHRMQDCALAVPSPNRS